MIRINLLPVREARRKADLRQQLVLLGATLGASLVVVGIAHWTLAHATGEARQHVQEMNREIEAFKPQLAQVEAFQSKKAEIERKLEVIANLDRSRSGPVHLLDELATHAPARLWITKLAATKNEIKLSGMSLDNEVIAAFLTSLNDSPYFGAVELEETRLSEKNGLKLNSFEIRAGLSNPGAPAGGAPAAQAKSPRVAQNAQPAQR
jgi:type IV pilus assembly protein PilN